MLPSAHQLPQASAIEASHALDLLLTAAVAAGLLGLVAGLVRLALPAASPARTSGADLLSDYGRAWCLHQAVPFADALLGLAGTIDNRMIVPMGWSLDWAARLPIVLLCFVWPSRPALLAAHLVNIASWSTWMPAAWDHMCWSALTETTFVLAVLAGGSRHSVAARFLPAVRAQLLVLYCSAAFWKLTTSWFDSSTSCASVLLSELLSGVAPPGAFPPGALLSELLLRSAPILVAGLEFAVPASLLLCPRGGVLLALVFHQTINLMPMTYAGGFSITCCSRLSVFVPGALYTLFRAGGSLLWPSAVVAAVVGVTVAVHGGVDSASAAYLFLAFCYLRGLLSGLLGSSTPCSTQDLKEDGKAAGGSWPLRPVVITVTLVYGFLTPIAGVQAMTASTMFANLKQFGGSNHLLVPTGLLQELFADQVVGSWQADAFGGGMVRVDWTNSSVMQELSPADATSQLPKHARALLGGINATGAYYELYAARIFFGRKTELLASALHKRGVEDARLDDPPYAQPAYELRRVLALARKRGESFKVAYTRVPYFGTPKSYRDFEGPQVVLEENAVSGLRTCRVGGEPCAADEIVLLPPPPAWLRWIFQPYPMPLLPADTTEVHCST